MKTSQARRIAARAETERQNILRRNILGQPDVDLHPLPEATVAAEISRFAAELRQTPNMEGYFDRRHFANLREHQREARHGFALLPAGGVLEILALPALPDEVMGFLIFNVYDPRDDADQGRCIGYAVWSLEKGRAPFGQADTVRIAFDIFPPFREGRYRKVPFTNHDIYNFARRVLLRFKPRRFVVDAKTQITQTRTGDPFKRAVYYLKRGYYPPDAKPLADACLVHMTAGRRLNRSAIRRLLAQSRSTFWVFPVEKYLKRGG
jgi:hypothetical protein